MIPQTVGDITVSRIVEYEGPIFPPEFLFPDADEETLRAHADWLLPAFIDPGSANLIMSFHSYLVRTPHHTILVDTCLGNHKHRPQRDFWHMRDGSLPCRSRGHGGCARRCGFCDVHASACRSRRLEHAVD